MPGSVLMLLSAASFGAMAVFGTLAYEEGSTVGTLLTTRFALAAAVWWAVIALSRAGRTALRGLRRRDALIGFALGAACYAGQAGGYFIALERIDAAVLALLVYTYPLFVAVAAVSLGRDRLGSRKLTALGLTSGGLLLVLAGAGTGTLDPVGTVLGILTALIYSGYILASEPVSGRLAPSLLAALVCTGAALTLTVGAAATGELRPGEVSAAGWGWLAALALLSTGVAVALFFAGLRRVGPTAAAILSTTEPLVTVVLALIVFGQALAPVQALGGALMLGGVLVLHARPAPRPAHATA